jgi:hypothetical protein
MAAETLSEELLDFIARHIESVEKLEILLLLVRQPERFWSARDIFQQIQSSPASVEHRLDELHRAGLLEKEAAGSFRFQPVSAESRKRALSLQEAYDNRRIKVIEAIYHPRNDELRKFSDAFRMRKGQQ